ncbi:MAG: ABC transporter permease [Candidatus Nephthysia bennettiae]|uniref:ABC transporter permease n=1 Tax=Candidatus Nephthysia bennettiae TaxID=3127016 RepID=A0A934N7K3_9BACT|nr:ABC transporter permease [Candidatus Dormibacteraeota bacterium]MBJ7613638.1 ABC transporter permease [Candidatus Dormibacteraeota bacterium]PZS00146.1 MAG: ABC transporter permease [Candidatus Dormibacteraeota bacterium]
MTGYLVRRAIQAVIVLLLVSMIVFLLLHELPGGTARAVLGERATNVAIAQFNRDNALDQPLPVQYWRWLNRTLHGDLGFSFKQNEPVSQLLAERLPKTVLLAGISVLLALLVSIPLGLVQAVRRNTLVDYILTGAALLLYSTPAFWLALLLITFLAIHVRIFPAQAPQGSIGEVIAHPSGLVLPVLTIALVSIAFYSRYVRSSTLENLTQDYVRTARAKGASSRRVVFRHVLRNVLVPVVTLVGLSLPFVFAGTLISEEIFNYPGTGLLFYSAAVARDYPVLLGVTLVVGTATVVGSLLADICYALLDPRVRLTGE